MNWIKIEQGFRGTLLYAPHREDTGKMVTFDVMFDHTSLPAPSDKLEKARRFADSVAVANKTVHAVWDPDSEEFRCV